MNLISLGYDIEFSKFNSTLKINISKKSIHNNDYIISQVVPYYYLNDMSRLSCLVNFMLEKLDKIKEILSI